MDKIAETRTCKKCGGRFAIADWDIGFYEKMNVPVPLLCPSCREARRLSHINQLHLFKRQSDATGESIISNYPPEHQFKVFSQKFWTSDAFDGIQYGRDFDFKRPFFEQYKDLLHSVPRPALFTDYLHDENSA